MKKFKKVSIVITILIISMVMLAGCAGYYTPSDNDSPDTGRVTDGTTDSAITPPQNGKTTYPINNQNLDTDVPIETVGVTPPADQYLEDTVAKIHPTVVEINAVVKGGVSMGSGVIISIATNYTYILTCQHVVDTATEIKIILTNGKSYPAYYVGGLGDQDIAVVKIATISGLTAAKIRDVSAKPIRLGEDAIVIGNPLGLLGGSVSKGVISSVARQINVGGNVLKVLQTDAAINNGNSGGGIFDRNGLLVGIVNASATGTDVESLGFALHIDNALSIAKNIIATANDPTNIYGGLGYVPNKTLLGIATYKETKDGKYCFTVSSTNPYGSFVSGTDTPILVNDIIIEINGFTVGKNSTVGSLLGSTKIGDTVTVKVVRTVRSGWTTTQKEMTLSCILRQFVYGYIAE